jgi:hypothetical protein
MTETILNNIRGHLIRVHCVVFFLFLPVMALYFGPFRTFLSFNIMMRSSPACSRKKKRQPTKSVHPFQISRCGPVRGGAPIPNKRVRTRSRSSGLIRPSGWLTNWLVRLDHKFQVMHRLVHHLRRQIELTHTCVCVIRHPRASLNGNY